MVVEYTLPGFGTKTNGRCNTVLFADHCPDCHTTELKHYKCKNWECPVCYHSSASRGGERIADRLYGGYLAYRSIGIDPGPMNHLVFSMPSSEYESFEDLSLRDQRRLISKYAKMVGVSGGVSIIHPKRIKDEYKVPVGLALQDLGVDTGSLWEGVHLNALDLDSWLDYTTEGLHIHVVGYFRIKMKSNDFEELTGWTYKNITWEKRHKPEDKESVRRIASYLLTHHSIVKGKQSFSYFGLLSNGKLTKTTRTERVDKECPECSSQMYKVSVDSEERLQGLLDGTFRMCVDQFSIKSRLRTIRNYYDVRPPRGVKVSPKDDPRLRAWKVAHGYYVVPPEVGIPLT